MVVIIMSIAAQTLEARYEFLTSVREMELVMQFKTKMKKKKETKEKKRIISDMQLLKLCFEARTF